MESLAPLLEKLAEKLGTTSSYLWSVLIKQAFIDGILSIIFCVLIAIWTYALWYDGYDEGTAYAFTMAVIAVLICALVMLYNIPTAFLNPEYWALKEVLSAIKPK